MELKRGSQQLIDDPKLLDTAPIRTACRVIGGEEQSTYVHNEQVQLRVPEGYTAFTVQECNDDAAQYITTVAKILDMKQT